MKRKTHLLVGIYFSDNDFWKTVTTFLHLFLHLDPRTDPASITKAKVVEMFNKMAPNIYWLCQNWGYNDTKADHERIEAYLKIEERHVFLEDACISKVNEGLDNGENGEFHYVDVDQGEVFSL